MTHHAPKVVRAGRPVGVHVNSEIAFDRDVGLPGIDHLTVRRALELGYAIFDHRPPPNGQPSKLLWTDAAERQADYAARRMAGHDVGTAPPPAGDAPSYGLTAKAE